MVMDALPPLRLRRATPDDDPAIADLLAHAFRGKYAVALGWSAHDRARRMLALLPTGILCPGPIYVVEMEGAVVATLTLRLASTTPTARNYQAARDVLQSEAGRWRAWWAVAVLRRSIGPRVAPDEAYLDNLVVAPAHRRQGIATQAAPLIYEECRRLGLKGLVADVMSSNYRVGGLFRQQGWAIIHRNYWVAPLTWPLFRTAGIIRVRKALDTPIAS